MATNNSINLTGSGIVSYDGAGTFSALANPLTVGNGGQGNSSLVAYTPLCGGTTTTNPVQSVASIGVAGQILTSNGAGSLPTFQTGSGGYIFRLATAITSSLADSTTYFIRAFNSLNTSTSSGNNLQKLFIPITGSIVGCSGIFGVEGTLGSSETCSINIRINNTTDNLVTSTLALTSAVNTFVNSSLGIAVTKGDYIEVKLTTPAWATNPGSNSCAITIYLI